MSGFAVRALAIKDLRRQLQDRLSFVLWLGIPLVIGSLITLATGGSDGAEPKARVWLVDEDDGLVSGLLGNALGQTDVVEVESVTDVEEGQRRILDGEGTAVLVIPAGFQDALLEENPLELRLITNPSQRILPGIVEESLELLAEASFYLHRIVGDELRDAFREPDEGAVTLPDAEVAAISVAINEIVREVEQTLLPPVIEVELESTAEEPTDADDDTPVSLLFLPGILFMAMFFTAQGLSEDFWKEKEDGTLRRGLCSPVPTWSLLCGKAAAAALTLAAVALIALGIGTVYHGLSWMRLPFAVLWTTLAGVGAYLGFAVLLSFSGSRRGSSILANALLMPALMIGGSFFPLEIMPDWMGAIGRLTPNGFAVVRLSEILRGPVEVGGWLVGLVGAAAVLSLLGAAAVRRLPGFAGVER